MRYIIFAMIFSVWTIQAGEIKVAVAANVGYVIETLKEAFLKTHPETKIQVIIGSSGKLAAQIKHGAPFEIFMSADMHYPKMLYKDNLAISKPVTYAQGELVYFSENKQDFSKGIELLKNKSIRKIALANPKTAPYGVAAKEALENAKIYNTLKNKFVYAESISQTASYVLTAADIGIIAKSSLFSPSLLHYKKNIHWEEVDVSLYTPIDQGIVVLERGKQSAEVQEFYDFILSMEAKNIFKAFGYKVL